MRILLLGLCASLQGCASLAYDIDSALVDRQPVELTDTPFFPQEQYQCGPAALATLLGASGVRISPSELSPTVYTPGRRGSLQQDLIGATRTAGRLPYTIGGEPDLELESLLNHIEQRRPVLVLQNLGIGWWSQWHYAVVIGYDPFRDQIILRSGPDERRVTPVDAFLNTWARSNYWGIVALRPDHDFKEIDQANYFRAIAAVESIGESQTALLFWESARIQWPTHPVPMLGQGNAQLALHDFAQAKLSFERLLQTGSFRSVATNNLAYVTARLGRFDDALRLLDAEIASPQDLSLVETLHDTRRDVLTMQAAHAETDLL